MEVTLTRSLITSEQHATTGVVKAALTVWYNAAPLGFEVGIQIARRSSTTTYNLVSTAVARNPSGASSVSRSGLSGFVSNELTTTHPGITNSVGDITLDVALVTQIPTSMCDSSSTMLWVWLVGVGTLVLIVPVGAGAYVAVRVYPTRETGAVAGGPENTPRLACGVLRTKRVARAISQWGCQAKPISSTPYRPGPRYWVTTMTRIMR